MARRSRVDDDARESIRPIAGEHVADRQQRKDLVGTRERGVDERANVVEVEICAAVEDLGDRLAPSSEKIIAHSLRIDRPDAERGAVDGGWPYRELDAPAERRQQSSGWIGGHDEGARPLAREVLRQRG